MIEPSAHPSGHDDSPQAVPVNVVETTHEWLVIAPMPGLEPRDITIEGDGARVTLRGRKRGPGQERHVYQRREWSYGPFERMVELPGPAALARANASYDNGILSLAVPKSSTGAPDGPVSIGVEPTGASRGNRVGHRGVEEAASQPGAGAEQSPSRR